MCVEAGGESIGDRLKFMEVEGRLCVLESGRQGWLDSRGER